MTKSTFMHEDFLLDTKQARRLYHEYAEGLPVIDYHCHLPPEQVAVDHRFENLAEIWLHGDHYKWRAMRTNGVPERYCTGDASDWEKFEKWAETMPYLLRNPLYHWTHLELKKPFGITDKLLGPTTAREIYDACNEMLKKPDFSARGIMKMFRVRLVCTTDDPVDSLEAHQRIAEDPAFDVQVLPAWRPDRAMGVENRLAFNRYLDRLAEMADVNINDLESFLEAIKQRHDFFHERGCRLSDHGLETVYCEETTPGELAGIFAKVRGGADLQPEEIIKFKSAMLHELAVMDQERGWVQQFHLGVMRNNNSRSFDALGPDTGFDSIGDFQLARPLARFLNGLERKGALTRTILYNINPADNAIMATMIGNFQDGSCPGRMQWGSGWWFLDQLDGMTSQIETLSQMGLLSRFVGMLTDSRSFLSYTRHEYFRRLLCNILGGEMARGLLPDDPDLVGSMVIDIGYNNAVDYFGYDLPKEPTPRG